MSWSTLTGLPENVIAFISDCFDRAVSEGFETLRGYCNQFLLCGLPWDQQNPAIPTHDPNDFHDTQTQVDPVKAIRDTSLVVSRVKSRPINKADPEFHAETASVDLTFNENNSPSVLAVQETSTVLSRQSCIDTISSWLNDMHGMCPIFALVKY